MSANGISKISLWKKSSTYLDDSVRVVTEEEGGARVDVEIGCEEVSKREVVVSTGRLLVSAEELEVCCSEVVEVVGTGVVDGTETVDDEGGSTVEEEKGLLV